MSVGSSPTLPRQSWESCAYDVWHDRAVFHFLTAPEERVAYVRQVANAVKPGGHVIVVTFGTPRPHEMQRSWTLFAMTPSPCTGSLAVRFRLLGSSKELHRTPFDTIQHFFMFLQSGMRGNPESTFPTTG